MPGVDLRQRLQSFPLLPPVAFAIVMSTGTLACATQLQAEVFPLLAWPARALNWLNFILFALLAPYAAFTWLARKNDLRANSQAPAQEAFFATCGIALLVLAHQCLFFSLGFGGVAVFWLAGAALTFFLNFTILYKVFLGRNQLESVTPVLFIPVVGLAVVPVAGCSLVTHFPDAWGALILIVCMIALGAAILLYSGLFAAMLQRHLLLDPIPDYLTPTLWIHLAPLGWGSISLLFLGNILASPAARETLEFFALLAWGAAAWWVVMAAILTIRAVARHGLKFSLAWWSCIFPLGSFAILTRLINLPCSRELAFGIWLLLLLIWLIDAARTVGALGRMLLAARQDRR